MHIYACTLTGKKLYFDVEVCNTIGEIKEMIRRKEGIPLNQQRLVFEGKSLSDERTLSDYNINKGSRLDIFLVLRGGGGENCSFVDITNKSGIEKIQWSDYAPKWRIVSPGLTLEGKCQNKNCEAYKCQVLMNQGMGNFDLLSDKTHCPVCRGEVKAFTCGFSNCKYRFVGQKEDGTIVSEENWAKVGDEFNRFNREKSGTIRWKCLVCVSRKSEKICFLCMETIYDGGDKYSCPESKHHFHRDCIDRVFISSESNAPITCIQCI